MYWSAEKSELSIFKTENWILQSILIAWTKFLSARQIKCGRIHSILNSSVISHLGRVFQSWVKITQA